MAHATRATRALSAPDTPGLASTLALFAAVLNVEAMVRLAPDLFCAGPAAPHRRAFPLRVGTAPRRTKNNPATALTVPGQCFH